MARIKGLAVRARLDFLEARFGAQGLSRVLEALTPEHAGLLRGSVLVSGWYPLSLSEDILGCMERLLGEGDGALCRQIGRASAEKGLSTVHHAFAAQPAPADIAAKMTRSTALLWSAYYDTGEMRTRALGEREIESELHGLLPSAPWLCHVLTGYIGAHIEVLGGRVVEARHVECRAQGDPRCRWLSRWQT